MSSHPLQAPQTFAGVADLYDRVRPRPPHDLLDLLCQLSGEASPIVVDIGAGTGHSTMHWLGRASQVVAVEPSADMRRVLLQNVAAADSSAAVRVLEATAEDTGLPDASAHVVTAGQAMHWFDPGRAFNEIARVLVPGGLFAAYDPVWPPTVTGAVTDAYENFKKCSRRIQEERGIRPPYASRHLSPIEQLRASSAFRHISEVHLHHRDTGGAQRLLDAAYSIGGTKALVESGVSEDELGLTRLRTVCAEEIPESCTWWWTYVVRLAVK
jgi:SAM-dependent methyltransferase